TGTTAYQDERTSRLLSCGTLCFHCNTSRTLQKTSNWNWRLHRPLPARLYRVMAYLSCQLLLRHRQRTRAARLSPPEHRPIPGIQMQRQGSSSRDRKRSSMEEFLPRHRPRKTDHGPKILYQSGQSQEQTPPDPRSTTDVSSQKGQGVAQDSSTGTSS